MSYSTDSLKKKVCVTVFLDELFEEVFTDDGDRSSQHGNLSTSELIVSKTDVEAAKSRSRNSSIPRELTPQEKPKILPKESNSKTKELETRPRKPRRESKFSKNPYKVLKNREQRKPLESGISESDADDKLALGGIPKKVVEDSPRNPSKVDPPKKNSSSKIICCTTKVARQKVSNRSLGKSNTKSQYDIVLYNSKSTQVDNRRVQMTNTDRLVGDSLSLLEEEQKQIVEDLAWKKTQKQIQLILAKAKNWYEVKEACEGDRIRRYDLRSILEECEKAEEQGCVANRKTYSMTWSTDFYDSDAKDLSDSYTCVFPHNKASRLKRVTNKQLLRDGFESDLSEVECISYEEGCPSMKYKRLLCYTSCINCKQDVFQKDPKENEDEAQSIYMSEGTPPDASLESLKLKISKTSQNTLGNDEKDDLDQVCSTTAEAAESAVETEVKDSDKISDKMESYTQCKGVLWDLSGNKRKTSVVEFERMGGKQSEVLFCLESKEKLFICEEILKRVGESVEGPKKIIITPNEIEILAPYDKKGNQILSSTQGIAEVFIKKEYNEEKGKVLSEAESETVFADSDNFTENKDLYADPSTCTALSEDSRGVRVLEFEDELTGSKILRRMETVEILGNCSSNGMRNISAEVILICENISNEDVCLEAWQSSTSTLKSVTDVGECYLKDSKDSSMYLIEIPFHFKRAKKGIILDG